MNFHLIFVHFPIGILTLYAVCEYIPFRNTIWVYIKTLLVVTGAFGAFLTLQTGELIEDQFNTMRNLVELHSTAASVASTIFAVIACVYLLQLVHSEKILFIEKNSTLKNLVSKTQWLVHIFYRPWFLRFAAICGFVALIITGALGGAIAHGVDVDPIASFVYHLFY